MKLSLEEKATLTKLSERASDLLVDMINEDLPSKEKPTKKDLEFEQLLSQIYKVSPLLSDSYRTMYNYLQQQKASPDDSYIKQLRKH